MLPLRVTLAAATRDSPVPIRVRDRPMGKQTTPMISVIYACLQSFLVAATLLGGTMLMRQRHCHRSVLA